MPAQFVPIIAFVVPFVLAFVFRVHSAMLFFGIAVGVLLQQAVGDSLSALLDGAAKGASAEQLANGILLITPVLAALFFFRKTMVHINIFMQLLPLILTSAACAMLCLQLLPAQTLTDIYATSTGAQIKQAEGIVIAAAAILNLLLAWRTYRVPAVSDKHHKH